MGASAQEHSPTHGDLRFPPLHLHPYSKNGWNSIRSALGIDLNDGHKHRFAAELRTLYGDATWNSFYKFSFVRNPWDRLVSWWSTINQQRPLFEAGRLDNPLRAYILHRARSFENFLAIDDDDLAAKAHGMRVFRNQVDYLCDAQGKIIVDVIGRFERLEEDATVVLRRLGISDAAIPRLNTSTHERYTQYYTPSMADFVATRYARDIEAFGYRFGE